MRSAEEIATLEHGQGCYECLLDAIRAAQREAAEAMRERAGDVCHAASCSHGCEERIRALSLPGSDP